ncbi:copper amine oxidase N-terminal domain-containing protein [Paenibacillus athensensis]|uniref:Copper amine oxidase-like N-terminal domain-containing protein n=1 Tax=Paenibacillus athensensis TaxID=1967502 RepID=A0A4Y8Q6J1_9BACL|nr:copper amine oxidase N-terminal domain-containing protein [Paenibacillus athensensis]MCD1259554.1 copper amine oxidase N-terminal domain-containing protein [Paenibacillus athensensis]
MFRKALAVSAAAAVALTGLSFTKADAAPGSDLRMVPVIVNGQKVKFPDTEPYINTDGRTMVPVRFVSEKLGANVAWEADTKTAVITYGSKSIRMPIGSRTVTVDGKATELDTAAEFTDGRTMVPLRFVSEVLASKVEWDDEAHSVKVTDAQYQAKIDAGEVALDPWGREYSKNWDADWMKLTDLEGTGFYEFYGTTQSRNFIETAASQYDYKFLADAWGSKIRNWYAAQLNVDYRTINEDVFVKAFMDNANGAVQQWYEKAQMTEGLKKYVAWVKENKVIAKGYADPELSTVYRGGDMNWVPTHFKFMILSAEDTAQTFLDNWEVSPAADSFKLQKGVWYEGYSSISMNTNVANSIYGTSYGIRHPENMFRSGEYFYNIVTSK